MAHTNKQLQQIMANSRKRVFGSEKPPEPVAAQMYDTECSCGQAMKSFVKPDDRDLPPMCEACRMADDQRREAERAEVERVTYLAYVDREHEKQLALVRSNPPSVLAGCGVPYRWRGASFDECPDLPKTIVEAAKAWAQRPTGMVLYTGQAGAGKTWLAVAVLREVLALPVLDPKFVKYISEAAYLEGLRASFNAGDAMPTPERKLPRDDIRRIPLLLYDDLGSTRLTAWGAGSVAELIATRHAADLATIVTSNLDLGEIAAAVDGRTASRLADDKQVYKFPAKDLRVQGKLSFRDRVLGAIKAWGKGPKLTGPPER